MKNKMHRDLPWKPMHWVGGKTPINLSELSEPRISRIWHEGIHPANSPSTTGAFRTAT